MPHVNTGQGINGRRWRRFQLLAGLAWCLAAPAGVAQSYDCDHGTARIGDSVADVAARCRTPDHVETWSASPPGRSGAVWFFNDGASRLLRMLRFRDDRFGSQGLQHVFRQRWQYDFGPRYLVREFTIDDASISHVRTLGRGATGKRL